MSSIFLSHSHKDKPFARRLSEQLQAHGIQTWLDEAELQVGDSLISKIENAIRQFEYLGIILSANSVSSEWVLREVNIALTEEIHGRKVKVLPLLYEKCEVPGFLLDKIYADFTGNFEEGFEMLLDRLIGDLHEEKYKQKRAHEIFLKAYQDWISFDRRDNYLLIKDTIIMVLQYINQPKLSLELMEYLLLSVAHIYPIEQLGYGKFQSWLSEMSIIDVTELFCRLLKHPNPQLRQGVIALVEYLKEERAIDVILTSLKHEKDRDVKRAELRNISRFGKYLPRELAQSMLNTDKDWIIQSYALRNLKEHRSCLLISDGTEFATELGILAQNAGYRLTTLPTSYLSLEADNIDYEVLNVHELLILVRGEHFTQYGNEHFYSKLERFVSDGGLLFATAWVSWETKYHYEFAGVLPFTHIRDSYNENVLVKCQPTGLKLAQELFPDLITYHASFELLRNKEKSIVLLETDDAIPVFGYQDFGSGVCYYLNTCQHSCFESMPSPLRSCPELYGSLQRVFTWIYEKSRHFRSNGAKSRNKVWKKSHNASKNQHLQ